MNPWITNTIHFVKSELEGAESAHDFFHIERVWTWSKRIGEREGGDIMVIELGALLHDIADSKFHNGDEEIGPSKALAFMSSIGVDQAIKEHVVNIIRNISFKGGHKHSKFHSKELCIVQDADRLDAIGAIGIARTFNYGGFKNREIYNPEIPPNWGMSKEEYKSSTSPTINHFYEKLLLLKDLMNTETGRIFAEERHQYMVQFLEHFHREWNAEI